MYLVGLQTYCKMTQGPYNIKFSHVLLVMPHTQFDTLETTHKVSVRNFTNIFLTPRCTKLHSLLCTCICGKCFFFFGTSIIMRVPF